MAHLGQVAKLLVVKVLRSNPAVRRHERSTCSPMRYVTDGRRLFRIVSLFQPGAARPVAELEDCMTLEIGRYTPDDLFEMRLRPVNPGERID